jgi:hypothetical protein
LTSTSATERWSTAAAGIATAWDSRCSWARYGFWAPSLARPAEVPDSVARPVAEELGVTDPGRLADYAQREPTHREHAGAIQREYGYRDFSDLPARADLRGWLDARAWATAERPSVLFDLATARLIEAKVLLPGASVLARAVASARDRAAARLHRTLAEAAGEQRHRLEQLLEVPAGGQLLRLEELRSALDIARMMARPVNAGAPRTAPPWWAAPPMRRG